MPDAPDDKQHYDYESAPMSDIVHIPTKRKEDSVDSYEDLKIALGRDRSGYMVDDGGYGVLETVDEPESDIAVILNRNSKSAAAIRAALINAGFDATYNPETVFPGEDPLPTAGM